MALHTVGTQNTLGRQVRTTASDETPDPGPRFTTCTSLRRRPWAGAFTNLSRSRAGIRGRDYDYSRRWLRQRHQLLASNAISSRGDLSTCWRARAAFLLTRDEQWPERRQTARGDEQRSRDFRSREFAALTSTRLAPSRQRIGRPATARLGAGAGAAYTPNRNDCSRYAARRAELALLTCQPEPGP